MADQNQTETLADLVIKADKNVPSMYVKLDGGRQWLISRDDFKLTEVTPPNAADVLKPKLVEQNVKLQTRESLVDYVNRFKNTDTVLFADMARNTVLAIIDYHHQPVVKHLDPAPEGTVVVTPNEDVIPAPELCKHTARLDLPFSLEWSTWMGANNRLVSHKEFATFLEHNSIDVQPFERLGLAESDEEADRPQSLLEMTRQLQVTRNVKFDAAVRHDNYDRIEFAKTEDATARGGLSLPLSFEIMIPVYLGEPAVLLTCMIRKEIRDDGLKLGYSVLRAENVRQEEFQRITGLIAAETNQTMLLGTPS